MPTSSERKSGEGVSTQAAHGHVGRTLTLMCGRGQVKKVHCSCHIPGVYVDV